MPEVRCPMCSKLNEAEIDICVFCGARLKPLVLDPASEDTHTEAPQEASGEAGADGEARKKGTDWLGRLRSAVGFSEESDAPEAEEADELPDWLDRLRPPASIGTLDEGEEIVHPFEESGDTDWLTRLRTVDDPTEATAEEKDLIEEQADFADEPALAPAVIPEWLQVTRVEEEEDADDEDEDDLADEEVDAVEAVELGERLAMHAPAPSARDDTFEDEEQSFDDEAIGEPEEIEAGSDAAEEECEAEEPPAPYVPALILGDEAPEDEPEDVDLESITVPEWVGDEQMPEAYAADRDAGDRPEITKAVLPEWLEAMRPIETFRTQEEEEEGEQPQPVETIGPLAGLSDVLMAEPVVAMPRIPGVVAASVSVTQQESEQVHVLRKLVEAERQDFAPARPRQRAAPILHWIVGLLLVAATILPQLITDAIFPAPRWVPQDLETLRNLVEELPRDRPALLVADYDPGYAAELEAVGSSLLDHLFQRGMSVVTLSTRASGPALAQRLIDHITAWQIVEAGDDYLHLGYLAGGPTAVQLFASNPRYGNLHGFMLPEDHEWSSPWEAPILSTVQRLSDFSVVVVITAGTETARTWAEQAAPLTGETPFVMVLSAGAEPLVRPYYANPDPQVDAIFTGLPSGKANEMLNGRNGSASLLWDAFGAGGWAATGVLVVGGAVGLLSSLLRRRAKDGSDV